MHPATRLRATIRVGVAQVASAHSPLSALLVEEAGFDGIWASGFELSALYGVPDASLITMTDHLNMVRAMAARCSTPIVADLDTGFGNAANAAHAVREYERAGVSAVVIEDKRFPKATSLLEGARQDLVSIAEFQGKIAAAVDARVNPDVMVIGRTEALIAGLPMREALERAQAYMEAGADMILVHSKKSVPDEILEFARAWSGASPVVIVPTAYPGLTLETIRAAGCIRMVIHGNHTIRAAVTAMQQTLAQIRRDGHAGGAHQAIVPVKEIFRLQGVDALTAFEARFVR